jgi:CheY-like chemotaxis protein
LQKLNVEVLKASSGNDALALTLEHDFCLAIVDVQMPGMDGYELVEFMRSNQATAALPVIFVSAIFSDEYHHRKGYESGAVDFMSKPFVPEILLSKVRVFIELYEQRQNLQQLLDELNRSNVTLMRRNAQIEASVKVGQQITSILNLSELLPQVVLILQLQYRFSLVSIWLIDEKKEIRLEASSKSGMAKGTLLPANHGGLVAKCFRSGDVALENKASTNSAYTPTVGLNSIGSELSLPLKIQKEILGILDIQSERLQAFSPEDISALQIVTGQIAIAIRNGQLYSEVVRWSQERKLADKS